MSVGLLRTLVQNQVVTVEQAEHYYKESQAGKEVCRCCFQTALFPQSRLLH